MMSPKVTLYIAEKDQAVWDRAKSMVPDGQSLSSFVTTALRQALDNLTPKTAADRELRARLLRMVDETIAEVSNSPAAKRTRTKRQ